jgi:outer membrane protein W
MRSPGDENTFRLIPLALTATYRFTWLDDEYGIPVVPYIRGGLAYYIWMVRTNGDTAKACWDGTHTQNCDADKALGASLGVVGSIGLAIRAERVDASAASSMRQSGIMHAGFYGELSLAKVDGFGSDTKLSVGDRTWFAGVDFEF